MTGRPAAFSALALASTASVADSEMADTRAETLVDMGSILAPGGRCLAAIYSAGAGCGRAVRRGGRLDVHCMDRQPSCRLRQHARVALWLLAVLRREAVLCLKALYVRAAPAPGRCCTEQ